MINTTEEINLSDLPILNIEKGILCFEDSTEFEKYYSLMLSASNEILNEWEEKIGFTSTRYIWNSIIEEETMIDTEAEGKGIKEEPEHSNIYKYYLASGFIQTSVDTSDNSEYFDLTVPFLQYVLNVNHLVKIGNKIYKYEKDQVKIINDGDFDKINILNKIPVSNSDYNITVINIKPDVYDVESTYWYPLYKGSNWTYNGKYRVKIELDHLAWNYIPERTGFVEYYIRVYTQKKNFWGKWKPYITTATITGSWHARQIQYPSTNSYTTRILDYYPTYSYTTQLSAFNGTVNPTNGNPAATGVTFAYRAPNNYHYGEVPSVLNFNWSAKAFGVTASISK